MRTKTSSLALLLTLAPLGFGCGKSGAGPIDAAVPDAFIDADFGGWDPPAPATISATPTLLDFGTLDVGSASTAQSVTIVVTGGPLTPIPTIAGPGFALTANTCTGPLTNAICTVSVKCSPAAIGAATGVLTVDAVGSAGGPVIVALSGTGVIGPSIGLGGERVDLGTLRVNQEAPAVVMLAPTRPVAALACTSSSPDLTLASQTCPTTGKIEAPCTFTFTFKAATAGAKNDQVICAGGGIILQRTVVANVVAPEPLTISPTVAIFHATMGTIAVVAFTVSNAGGVGAGPLTATLSESTDFSIVSNGCASAIASTATCTIQVALSPMSVGVKSAILTVSDSSQPTRSASATLVQNGSTPNPLLVTPSTADFGTVIVGQASAPRSFTLKNSGGSTSEALTITSSDPAFVVEPPSCPSLGPGAACTFAVTFKPNKVDTQQAEIYLTDPQGVLRAVATVVGLGRVHTTPAPLVAFPPTLDFGTLAIGTRSAPQVFTVTNTGDKTTGALSVQTADSASDGGASEFATTTTCAAGLPAGATCTVTVTFQPIAPGSAAARVFVTDGTTTSSMTAFGIAVTTGGPTLNCAGSTSSSVTFSSTTVGQTSEEVVCTVFDGAPLDGGPLDAGRLDGGALDAGALAIAATTTGDFAVTGQGCTLSQCSVRFVFKPSAQGVRTGTLTAVLTQGSVSSIAKVMLTGTGL